MKARPYIRSVLAFLIYLRNGEKLNGLTAAYFVASGENAVKIGVTDDVLSRMKALQTASPLPLRLLAVMPGDQETEYDLHRAFAALRISGEWFRFEGPLKRLVEGIE